MIYRKPPKNFSPKFEVVSCFLEHDGEILLLQTGMHKSQGGKWGVPAGKMEEEETREVAMLRELAEETQLVIQKSQLHFLDTVYVRYADFDFTYHMFRLCFEKRPLVIIDAKEHTAYQWLSPQEALQLPLIEDEDACIKMHY